MSSTNLRISILALSLSVITIVAIVINAEKEEKDPLMPSQWSRRGTAMEVLNEFMSFATNTTKECRQQFDHKLNIPYGSTKKTLYDIYGTNLPDDAPIVLFIHGGYWHMCSRDTSGFIIPNFVDHGIKVVVGGFNQGPEVPLTVIAEQTRLLTKTVLTMAKSLGSKGVWLSGHSTGAHLSASILYETEWFESIEKLGIRGFLKGMFLVGGIYTIEPLVKTSVNDVLKFTPQEVEKFTLNPLNDGKAKIPKIQHNITVVVAVGEHDAPFYIEESRRFAGRLARFVDNVEFRYLRNGIDHFTSVLYLSKNDYVLSKLAVEYIHNA